MTAENTPSEQLLRVHVDGGLPSGRELAYLLTILECSLVWAVLALTLRSQRMALDESDKYPRDSKERREWVDAVNLYEGALRPLRNSYSSFLSKKYKAMLEEVKGDWIPWSDRLTESFQAAIQSEEAERNRRQIPYFRSILHDVLYATNPERKITEVLRRREFAGEDFNIPDFEEWISAYFGNQLLKTTEISPDRSIEFLFDAIAIASIVGLPSHPILQDILTYAAGALRGFTGKERKPPTPQGLSLPDITPEQGRFFGQFDEIIVTENRIYFRKYNEREKKNA